MEYPGRVIILSPETREIYQRRLHEATLEAEVVTTIIDNIDLLRELHTNPGTDFTILEKSLDTLRDMRDGLDAESGIIEEFLGES